MREVNFIDFILNTFYSFQSAGFQDCPFLYSQSIHPLKIYQL
jgi:hypothetical protein